MPSQHSENKKERELRAKIYNYKYHMSEYPQWQQDLLMKIPTLFDDNISNLDKFYNMVLVYKQRYGHVDIKSCDVIDGYSIGNTYRNLVKKFKNEELPIDEVEKLKSVGVDVTVSKREKWFNEKMQLAKKALSEGIVINKNNQTYHGINLYNWHLKNKNKFSREEVEVIRMLIPNQDNKRAVNIYDLENKQIYTFSSISEAGRALYNEFHVVNNEKKGIDTISCRLTGRIKNPVYKGRFMFKYEDNENGDDNAS